MHLTALTPADVLSWTGVVAVIATLLIVIIFFARLLGAVVARTVKRWNDPAALPPDEATKRHRRSAIVVIMLAALIVVGLVLIPYEPELSAGRWVPLEIAAIGVCLCGAFIGFLFGLPQLSDKASTSEALYRPSTNLEKVADRTATLLAGVALAQVVAIPAYIAGFADYINTTLGNGHIASAHVLAAGILLYFAPVGFILSFLCTKTIVAPELAFADESLANFARNASIVDDFPIWPDVPQNPTMQQQIAAQRIITHPLSSLTTAAQKATWARAQMLLNNGEQAIIAFQQAQVLTPRDAALIADYAQALYSTDDSTAPLALSLARQADADATLDAKMQSRLRSLIAVCSLYVPDGYEAAIETVNATLSDPDLATGTRLRFYRACGFGRMWRALKAEDPPRQDRHRLLGRIAEQIRHDTRVALGYPDLRNLFVLVTVAKGREVGSHDDDLQAFAHEHREYRTLLNIGDVDEPTTPVPPPPTGDVEEILRTCPL